MRHVQRTRGVYTNALLSEATTTVCHKAQGASPNSSYQDLASAIVPGAKRVKKPFKQVLEYFANVKQDSELHPSNMTSKKLPVW
jgi:hypothetical protein